MLTVVMEHPADTVDSKVSHCKKFTLFANLFVWLLLHFSHFPKKITERFACYFNHGTAGAGASVV